MAVDITLLSLFQELMEEYDSDIDTAEGASFYTQVMAPLLLRVGGSVLDTDLDAVLAALVTEYDPDINTSELSQMRTLIIQVMSLLIRPLTREIEAVRLGDSLNNYEQMTRFDLNQRLGNFFISLVDGSRESWVVRVYFSRPQTVVFTPLTRFSTGSGLNFFPTSTQSTTATAMAFQQEGSLYYADVTVEAEEAGTDYSVDVGAINTVAGVAGALRVSNRSRMSEATANETKAEGVARAQEAITQRNLITAPGVSYVLRENFPGYSTLQVIGKGDAEMLRDVVMGPAVVSSVPGGVVSEDDPAVLSGDSIHIGGMTDIYVYEPDLTTDTLDIENTADWGVRVTAGASGYTAPGSGTTNTFYDDAGHFVLNGVRVGDTLRVGAVTGEVRLRTSSTLTLSDAVLDEGLYGQHYEVVRSTDGVLTIPLYDLVAEADGVAVVTEDGDPVQAVPGDQDRGPLSVSGSYVAKVENIAANNVPRPLIRVSTVEMLDTGTLESTDVFIPLRDVVLVRALDDFSGGSGGYSTGTLRIFFRDACNVWVDSSTLFSFHVWRYSPESGPFGAGASRTGDNEITVASADLTETVFPGYRVLFVGGFYTVLSLSLDGGDTTITVREDVLGAGPAAYSTFPGVLQANMEEDTSGLYYFDVPVECLATGAGGDRAEDDELSSSDVYSEGWSVRALLSTTTFSTRELPYIELTNWVNDTTNIGEEETAYAVRLNLEYAPTLAEMQTLVGDEDYRITGEDALVRHFLPSYVWGDLSVAGMTEEDILDTVRTLVNGLSPLAQLDLSDIDHALGSAGATHVRFPLTFVSLAQGVDRSWSASTVQDTLGYDRVQHFILDEDRVVVTVE